MNAYALEFLNLAKRLHLQVIYFQKILPYSKKSKLNSTWHYNQMKFHFKFSRITINFKISSEKKYPVPLSLLVNLVVNFYFWTKCVSDKKGCKNEFLIQEQEGWEMSTLFCPCWFFSCFLGCMLHQLPFRARILGHWLTLDWYFSIFLIDF